MGSKYNQFISSNVGFKCNFVILLKVVYSFKLDNEGTLIAIIEIIFFAFIESYVSKPIYDIEFWIYRVFKFLHHRHGQIEYFHHKCGPHIHYRHSRFILSILIK